MGRLRTKTTNNEEYQEYQAKLRWLKRYGESAAQAQFLQDQLAEMESAATRVTARLNGMPGGGRDTARLARSVERIDEAKKRLDEQLARCVEYRLELVAALAKIQNPQAQEVLLRKYIAGESYAEICIAMGLVDRRVYQLHRMGVNKVMIKKEKDVQ